MQQRLNLLLTASLALACLATACAAQSVGVPTPQDTLENNLNALRGPSPGAPPRITVPTPQYYLPAASAPATHPGADALLSPTGVKLKPVPAGQRQKSRTGRKKPRNR